MIRNLKALGLALVAVFAMSALVASAAQAQFTVEGGGTATVAAEASSANQTFAAAFGSVKCKKVSGRGSFTSGATELTGENILYEECSALAGLNPATVDFPTGCHFQFTSNTAAPKIEETHLKCGTNETVTITVFETLDTKHEKTPVCTFHIAGPQKFPVAYDNVTLANGKMGIEVTANSVAVTTTHEGTLCGTGSETAHYTGNIRVSGKVGGVANGITVT